MSHLVVINSLSSDFWEFFKNTKISAWAELIHQIIHIRHTIKQYEFEMNGSSSSNMDSLLHFKNSRVPSSTMVSLAFLSFQLLKSLTNAVNFH